MLKYNILSANRSILLIFEMITIKPKQKIISGTYPDFIE